MQGNVAQYPASLSADGTELLFHEGTGGIRGQNLMALRVDSLAPDPASAAPPSNPQASDPGPNVRPIVSTANGEANGAFSPDGRWLAYQSNDSGTWDIYVRPVHDLERSARFTVSTGGGTQPRWSRNGRELFYLSPQNEMMSVQVGSAEVWSAGKPIKLFDASGYYTTGNGANPYFNYDVAKDGRFLMIKPKGDPAREEAVTTNLNVVQHWFEELKRLVPR